jgi:peroxiredoxin Q/BCP
MCLVKSGILVLTLSLALHSFANKVEIVDAKATKDKGAWTIAVTLNHADIDRKHFADMWRVVSEDGQIIGTRELGHPHKDQPFTRDLKNLSIPDSMPSVYIEAHDNVHGWTKEKFKIDLKKGLQVGDSAPDFEAVDQDGGSWILKNHLGDKYLVIYFYPAAMTGGCTKQACSYRDFVSKSSNQNIEIVGISGDSPQSLKYFQQAENLNFNLLSDPEGKIATAFGVPVRTGEKSLKRTVNGDEVELSRTATASRWTFVVDPQGKVVYRDDKVKAVQDLSNVMAFLTKAKE